MRAQLRNYCFKDITLRQQFSTPQRHVICMAFGVASAAHPLKRDLTFTTNYLRKRILQAEAQSQQFLCCQQNVMEMSRTNS